MAGDGGRRVEVRRLYQQTADEIRALIGAGTYRVDTRLPAERELAQQLGVSRPSLREALIALEIEGSVEIRMGSGVYVRTPPEPPVSLTLALGDSPSELMQARVIIEGTLILQACARMTPATLDVLSEAIGDMRAAVADGRDPLGADRLFHETIAQQAGNAVLARIVADLFEERHSRLFRGFSSRFEDRDTWTAALAEHEAILVALRAADPLRAQCALRSHLYASAERWIVDR
ncbi:FadR/GntR family transcriptional regulator [Lichenihabitans sp. Uapishka_5]|uniref:FadR/GntR family transcriptional regulator n=1 Tax=Lichenihabitans sp. Uapishka_5 TaxID=3037302 RepID=UPI0029E7FEFC|nr:FadR/GntR family transcriptional regulator [Lichenihabitans sp. Uapishka_5]MDX7951215.1 FadR/GntR family transcriptional regulator [Lichenihabitans sp. Uapishka_5]